MHSNLTEMLSSAQRDEMRRQASSHNVARQSRRSRRHSVATGPTAGRLRPLRFIGRRSHVRPAVIA